MEKTKPSQPSRIKPTATSATNDQQYQQRSNTNQTPHGHHTTNNIRPQQPNQDMPTVDVFHGDAGPKRLARLPAAAIPVDREVPAAAPEAERS